LVLQLAEDVLGSHSNQGSLGIPHPIILHTEMHTGPHVMCPLLLSDLNQNMNVSKKILVKLPSVKLHERHTRLFSGRYTQAKGHISATLGADVPKKYKYSNSTEFLNVYFYFKKLVGSSAVLQDYLY
jgi:hypothetical protein